MQTKEEQSNRTIKTENNTRNCQDFIFCHNPSSLKSIVMLANHHRILEALLKDFIDPHYFWIDKHIEQAENIVKSLTIEIRDRSVIFSSIDLLENALHEKSRQSEYKKIILIAIKQQKEHIMMLLRRKMFIGAILYNSQMIERNKQETNGFDDENEMENQNYCPRLIECSTVEQLTMALKFNRWSVSETKQFCNFVLLKQQVQKSTKLLCTMVAMIKQQIDIVTRGQIIDELASVIYKLAEFHPKLKSRCTLVQQALSKLKQKQISPFQILSLYTSEKQKFYLILNSFLRAMSCPTEIYYVWPLFRPLFYAVKQLHQQTPKKQILCYRGGYISQEEFKKLRQATGEVVQNLGFLSSSSTKSTAEGFTKNIIYKIRITNQQKNNRNVCGFAQISKYSRYLTEQEILFNPLNYFHILQAKTIQSNTINVHQKSEILYEISLEFGSKKYVDQKYHEQSQSQQKINFLLHFRIQIFMRINHHMDALLEVENNEQLSIAVIYFQFLTSQANKFSDKLSRFFPDRSSERVIEAGDDLVTSDIRQISKKDEIFYLLTAISMSEVLQSFGKELQAMQLAKKCEKAKQYVLSSTNPHYYNSISTIGNCLYKLKRYQQAFQYYLKFQSYKEIIIRIKGKQLFFRNQNNIGITLQKLNKFKDAFKVHKRCAKYRKEALGERHPDYLISLNNIGCLYHRLGRYQQALRIHQRCCRIRREVLGERHPHYLISLNNTAQNLFNIWKLNKSLKLHLRCASGRREVLGERHPDYLVSMGHIASVLQKLGKLNQALQFYGQCIKIMNSSNIRNENYFIFTNNYLATLISLNRVTEVLELIRLIAKKAIFRGKGSYFYPFLIYLVFLGRFENALSFFAELQHIFCKQTTFQFVRILVNNLVQLSRFNEALTLSNWYIRSVSKQCRNSCIASKNVNRQPIEAIFKFKKKIKAMKVQQNKKIGVSKTFLDK